MAKPALKWSLPPGSRQLAATLDTLHKHQVRCGGRQAAVRTKIVRCRGVRHPTPGEWAASKGPQRGPLAETLRFWRPSGGYPTGRGAVRLTTVVPPVMSGRIFDGTAGSRFRHSRCLRGGSTRFMRTTHFATPHQ
jgi:hypothetical protein